MTTGGASVLGLSGRRSLAILLAWGLVGCGRSSPPPFSEPTLDTVEGVVHVRNGPSGAWAARESWSAKEVLRIGAKDAPEEELFAGPLMTAAIGPNGHIHVLDSEADLISVFDGEGGFLRRIGGTGAGPGELSGPSGMTWDAMGRLWVADGLRGRYALFTPDGRFIRTQTRPVYALARKQHPLHYQDDGYVLDEASRWPSVFLVRVDTAGTDVDTVGVIRQPAMTPAVRRVPVRPGSKLRQILRRGYVTRRYWVVAPGNTVWLVDSGALRLVQTELSGDTLRVVHTRHRERAFTFLEKRLIRKALSDAGLSRSDVDMSPPVVQGLLVTQDGHVMVQIVEDLGRDSPVFDVFDPQGIYLGAIDLGPAPARFGVATFRGDTLVVPTIGESGVPYVVKVVIERPRQQRKAALW